MSRRNGRAPNRDLKVSLPRVPMSGDSPRRRSATASPTSPPSSCISSEMSQDDLTQLGYYSSSPEAQSMVLAGCQRCLMYVMLSEDDPKCPKCQNTVLLEFMQHGNNQTGSTSGASTTKKTRKNR
uniref:GIR1-like zinc ribbon domain-containing protein n=1 Tax=Kalanchoe fedtschenkoi TaxID=63787 RepID=A0A7N0V1W2_KALFE